MRVRKRPTVIDAVRFTGDNVEQIWNTFGAEHIYGPTELNATWLIITAPPAPNQDVEIGDWIVRTQAGGQTTYQVISDADLQAAYEPTAEQEPQR